MSTRRGPASLADPAPVGEEAPDRVVLVVPQPPGGKLDDPQGHGRYPGGSVGELAVDLRPGGRGPGRIGELELAGPLHRAVERRVAEVAVAGTAAATEELGQVGRRVGVVGEPVAVGG